MRIKNYLLLSLVSITMLFVSCANDDTADIIFNITNNEGGGSGSADVFLSGTYTNDLTLESGVNYKINGSLVMASGTTLTIPAGMTIKALAAGSDVYVAISQGAKIVAEGTSTAPIVFTSDAASPEAGDWGGLILLGKAPINSVTGTATSTSEIAGLPYGGNIADDDSGSLRYVRIEYSGGSADGQSENNGLSFYAVGNGTSVEYIQIYEGKDDGVEFFGGTVNVSYVSVINLQDDSIDWTEGYSGTISDVYVQPIQNPTESFNSDKAFECDGYNDDFGNNSSPVFFSSPTVNNVTIIGVGSSNTFQDGSTTSAYEAIRLRRGTEAIFTNVVISGYAEAFDLDGNDTTDPTGAAVIADKLQVNNITFTDVTNKLKNDTGVSFTEADFISGDGSGTGTNYATWGAGWTRQ
ncbi:multidrug transporter [Litoribaculum gwangyangense]|uniref:Multidrug transporter n=1 Tax=Litoribaculum gwangyangense TaxID=1130722 RepID=A0ABP9BXI2_9FLAO